MSDRARAPHAERSTPRHTGLRCTADGRARRTLRSSGTGWAWGPKPPAREGCPIVPLREQQVQRLDDSATNKLQSAGRGSSRLSVARQLGGDRARQERIFLEEPEVRGEGATVGRALDRGEQEGRDRRAADIPGPGIRERLGDGAG